MLQQSSFSNCQDTFCDNSFSYISLVISLCRLNWQRKNDVNDDMSRTIPQSIMGDSTRSMEGSVGCSTTPPDVTMRRNIENGYVEGCPFSRSNGMKPFSVAGTEFYQCNALFTRNIFYPFLLAAPLILFIFCNPMCEHHHRSSFNPF